MRRDVLEIDASVSQAIARDRLNLEDVDAIRLMLAGGSIVDWHRAIFPNREAVDAHLELLLLDMDDPTDRTRLRYVFNEAVSYLEEQLHLSFPEDVRNPDDVRDVFVWASETGGFRRRQILSCVALKLMHVIHHMEAADLKFRMAISEAELNDLAETRVLRMGREMRDAGLGVLSFYGSRKSRSSTITKLLAKKDTLAATIFDKLRFRIVVDHPSQLVPALQWMRRHLFPFNYVIPSQSHNNLVDPDQLLAELGGEDLERARSLQDLLQRVETGKNEFSAASYRMVNFIVDFPVRLPVVEDRFGFELGSVVFVMVEFQLVDEETARANEEGDNAHHLYKQRQHQVVAQRLKRGGQGRRGRS